MTPDMAHTSLLPWATSSTNWKWLFSRLNRIVVDEVHSYRGIFGSRIALLFRRLNRLAEQFGQQPQYVCTSATIANPIDHAASVTGHPSSSFHLVENDTSSRSERHWVLWNPPLTQDEKQRQNEQAIEQQEAATADTLAREQGATGGERKSYHVQSKNLFSKLVLRGYQVVCFSNTRQNCEKYAQWASSEVAESIGEVTTEQFPSIPNVTNPSLADRVRAYHGSLSNTARERVEDGLKTGAIRGVWSTSALGIGVDIGSLDVVILDGYPGSLMETFQWAGRAGRGDRDCLVVLVGSDNPLDQRLMEDPDRLFDEEVEKAIINPHNTEIIDDHLVCAADERQLTMADKEWFGSVIEDKLPQLEQEKRLFSTELGDKTVWRTDEDNVQYSTGLRMTGQQITLRSTSKKLGELDLRSALRDAHPNAIYRTNGTTYQVDDVEYDNGVAWLDRYPEQAHESIPNCSIISPSRWERPR